MMKNTKNGWTSCILALALAALPALAADEGGPGTDPLTGEPEAAEAAPEATSEPPSGRVARAGFTTQVVDREPQDSVTSLSNLATQILFYTELSGLEGHTLTHVWERGGTEMARVPFAVGGERWRVFSSKNLDPSWLGEWKVSVVDEEGRVLHSESFSYVASPMRPASGEVPTPSEEPSEEPAVPAAIE
jgi:hypothetical protein